MTVKEKKKFELPKLSQSVAIEERKVNSITSRLRKRNRATFEEEKKEDKRIDEEEKKKANNGKKKDVKKTVQMKKVP